MGLISLSAAADTKNRQHHFGDVRNGIMGLSDIGCIAAKFWQEIPKHFPFVTLDTWQVMPNHLHGILVIDKPSPAVSPVGVQNF